MNYPDEYMSLFHRLTVVASTWVSPQDAEDVVQDVLVGILEKQDLRLPSNDLTALRMRDSSSLYSIALCGSS